jgi:hypothetical protein
LSESESDEDLDVSKALQAKYHEVAPALPRPAHVPSLDFNELAKRCRPPPDVLRVPLQPACMQFTCLCRVR